LERALNAVVSLLTDAARAGHTVLPCDVVLRRCTQADADAAVADGSVIDVEWRGAPAWALTDVAESEELLADGLAALADQNRLAVVVGPDPAGRRVALARALDATTPSVVLDDAHLLGLDDVLGAVEDLAEDAVLVLALDNALPLADVPGAVALDVASTGACPVIVGDTERDARSLGLARASVASGTWPSARADDRTFVAVAASSPDEALLRVTQIVATSIPRAFGLGSADVAVLPWDADGPAGAPAVRAALGDAAVTVVPLREVGSRTWPATVVLLPGVVPPGLTRAVVYAALRTGVDHVSVVHGFGPDAAALAEVVAATSDRPRRTRLATLITDTRSPH